MADGFNWNNPVAVWWAFLVGVSLLNIGLWLWARFRVGADRGAEDRLVRTLLWLSAAYVFGCAYRSIWPKADVQRICLFDTWLSSVFLGRSVATIAELSFAAQWAIVLHLISRRHAVELARRLSLLIVPMIAVAECFSWYAVITTSYFGNTVEESLWAASFSLVAIILALLVPRLSGRARLVSILGIIGAVGYVAFMLTVDVPMYFQRWQSDLASGKPLFGFLEGMVDLNTRWVVTHSIEDWRDEIPWMSLYFSLAVWVSIALCRVPVRARRE